MNRFRSLITAGLLVLLLPALPAGLGARQSSGPERLDAMLRLLVSDYTQMRETGVALVPARLSGVVGLSAEEIPGTGPMVQILVHGPGGEGAVQAVGGAYGTRAGPVLTARVPLGRLEALASAAGIERLEAAALLYPTIDESVSETRADLLHAGAYNLRGQGVLVAVFDTGIDFTHDDFRHADGSSRILYLWDQVTTSGAGTAPSPWGYGREWSKAQIDLELGASPPGVIGQRDTNGHGSHVAGIAAGNGRATGGYVGMAPEANLLVIKGGDSSFPTGRIIDGMDWAFQKGAALGQPVVVNLSLGGQSGAHDGTAGHEVAIDYLSGPGQVVVTSAGNSGNDYIHDRVTLTAAGQFDSIAVVVSIDSTRIVSGTNNDYVWLTGWYESPAQLRVTMRSPQGTLYGPVETGNYVNLATEDGSVYIDNGVTLHATGSREMAIGLRDMHAADILPWAGTWQIIFETLSGTTAVDQWIYATAGAVSAALPDADGFYTVGTPGTARKAITVGSYATKKSWDAADGNTWTIGSIILEDISGFSSRGPTRDGRLKPEITAPGQMIAAAHSADVASYDIRFTSQDGLHIHKQGTSMSAPHVSGAVALMLQVRPYLTSEEVRNLLTGSAVADAYTGITGPGNNTWGWGKMDTKAAVDSILAAADDTTPPQFTIGLLPNHVLPRYLNLYVAPDEPLSQIPVARVNSDTLSLVSISTGGGLMYAADYELAAAGDYELSVYGRDLAGNDTTVVFAFSAAWATTGALSRLIDPSGTMELTVVAGSVTGDRYLLVHRVEPPEAGTSLRQVAGRTLTVPRHGGAVAAGDWPAFLLIGPAEGLRHDARLRVRYDPAQPGATDPRDLGLYHWNDGEWIRLTGFVDPVARTVEASIRQMGIYRLGIDDGAEGVAAITETALLPNYPNPFNADTRIRFTLSRTAPVELTILNVRGQRITTLLSGTQQAGAHLVTWDGRNQQGRPVTSGIYLVLLQAEGKIYSRKILLLR